MEMLDASMEVVAVSKERTKASMEVLEIPIAVAVEASAEVVQTFTEVLWCKMSWKKRKLSWK